MTRILNELQGIPTDVDLHELPAFPSALIEAWWAEQQSASKARMVTMAQRHDAAKAELKLVTVDDRTVEFTISAKLSDGSEIAPQTISCSVDTARTALAELANRYSQANEIKAYQNIAENLRTECRTLHRQLQNEREAQHMLGIKVENVIMQVRGNEAKQAAASKPAPRVPVGEQSALERFGLTDAVGGSKETRATKAAAKASDEKARKINTIMQGDGQ